MIELLRNGLGEVEIDVLSRWPVKTSRRHPRVNAIRSGVLRGLWATCMSIRNADLLVFGGGGIIQDASSFGNLLFHLSRLVLAGLLGTNYVGCGLGVGPIKSKIGRRLTSIILNRAKGVYVRDESSATMLHEIHVVKPQIVITSDFANRLSLSENFEAERVYQQAIQFKQESGCFVGLSLRPQTGKHRQLAKLSPDFARAIERIAKACDQLIERKNAKVVFVPMEPKEDIAISQHFLSFVKNKDSILVLSGELKPKVLMSVVALLDIMIGMRLHSLIFAARTLVPAIALDYDPKIAGFCKSLGQDGQVLKLQEMDTNQLLRLTEETLCRRNEIRQSLKRHMPSLEAGVDENINAVAKLIADKRHQCDALHRGYPDRPGSTGKPREG